MTNRIPTGFTLVELLLVIAVLGILASIAAPSFQDMMNKSRVRGAAEAIYSDLQLARQESIKRNIPVGFYFRSNSTGGWCYGIGDPGGGGCDCTTAAGTGNCQLGAGNTLFSKIVSSEDFPGVTLANPTDTIYNNVRGTANPSGAATVVRGNFQAQVSVSTLGSVSACTPTGQTSVGYPGC